MAESGDPMILPEGEVMVEVEGLGEARPRVSGEALPPVRWGSPAESLTVGLARYIGLYDHALEVPRGLKSGTYCLVRGVSQEAGEALADMATSLGLRAKVRPLERDKTTPTRRQMALLALTNTTAFFTVIFAFFAPFPIWLRLGVLVFAFAGSALAIGLEGRFAVPKRPVFSRNLRRHLSPAFAQGVDPWVPALEAGGDVHLDEDSDDANPGQGDEKALATRPSGALAPPTPPVKAAPLSPSEVALVNQWRALEAGSKALDVPGAVRRDLDPLVGQVGEKVEGLRHRLRVVEAGAALRRSLGGEDADPGETSDAHKALMKDILQLSELMMTLSSSLQGARGFEGDGRQVLQGVQDAMAGYLAAKGEVEGGLRESV